MKKCIKQYPQQYAQLPERFIKKLEHDLNYIQQRQLPGLRKIYLFGSAARGEVRSSSDIDLLIVTKNKIQDRELAADIRWTLDESMDGVRTDVVYRHEEQEGETEEKNSAFDRGLNKDKKLILEVIE